MDNQSEESKSHYQPAQINESTKSPRAASTNFLNMSDAEKETANQVLQYIEAYDLSGLRSYISKNPQTDLTTLYNFQGRTVLHSAVIKNEESIIELILSSVVIFAIL